MIIVPSNDKGTGFLRNKYYENKKFLAGLITKTEFNEIVDECSKRVAKAYSYNRNKDNEGVSSYIVASLGFATVCLFAYFFLLFYGIRDKDRSLRITGYILLGISIAITFAIGFYNYF